MTEKRREERRRATEQGPRAGANSLLLSFFDHFRGLVLCDGHGFPHSRLVPPDHLRWGCGAREGPAQKEPPIARGARSVSHVAFFPNVGSVSPDSTSPKQRQRGQHNTTRHNTTTQHNTTQHNTIRAAAEREGEDITTNRTKQPDHPPAIQTPPPLSRNLNNTTTTSSNGGKNTTTTSTTTAATAEAAREERRGKRRWSWCGW